MQRCFLISLVIVIASNAVSTRAVDLSNVSRAIVKEPVYASSSPRYCLLLFGPSEAARVWLVRDADALYIDKNGNGDLTEDGEQFNLNAWSRHFPQQFRESAAVAIIVNGRDWGKLQLEERRLHPEFKPIDENEKETLERYQKYDGGILRLLHVSALAPTPRGEQRRFAAKIRQFAGSDAWGSLTFAASRNDAPIVHFDGPLTLDVSMTEPKLEKSNEPFDFQVMPGTRGLGKGTFAAVNYYEYDAKGEVATVIPEGLYPEVEAEFPAKKASGAPIRVKWVLKQRC